MLSNLVCSIKVNEKYVFVDEEGKIVRNKSFDYTKDYGFTEGYCVFLKIKKKKNKNEWIHGFINEKGETINFLGYEDLSSFSNSLSRVRRNRLYGYMNLNMEEIIPCKYEEANHFSEGLACVKEGSRYKYIDLNGEVVIDSNFNNAYSFSCGLAFVKIDKNYFFINKKGEIALEIDKDLYTDVMFKDDMLKVYDSNMNFGFMDKEGNIVIPLIYEDANRFSEGLACVTLDSKSGYINKDGEVVIDFKYVYGGQFNNGLTVVLKKDEEGNKKWGYIDKTGKEVIPAIYDSAESFYSEYAKVSIGGIYFYIDKKGRRIF